MHLRILSALTTLIAASGCAKIVVLPLARARGAEGVFYALPKTVVRVQLKVDLKKYGAAPFAEYAPIFAPGEAPVCDVECSRAPESKTKYSVQQGATFSTYGEPDPQHIYLVKFVGGGAVDQSLSMTWTEAGLLSAATSTVTNRTSDVMLAGLRFGATLGTKMALAGTGQAPGDTLCPAVFPRGTNDPWIVPILDDVAYMGKNLVLNYCLLPKSVRDSFSQAHSEELRRAAVAYAGSVSELIRARSDAEKATVLDPLPLINRYDALIAQKLAALFLGTASTTTWEPAIDIRGMESVQTLDVLRVNPKGGVCIAGGELAPESKPVPKEFKVGEEACKDGAVVRMIVAYHPDSAAQLFAKAGSIVKPNMEEGGFRYRIPAFVKATLSDTAGTQYGVGVFPLAQLGLVATLPAKRNAKSITYELTMVESTGGLKGFKLGTTGGLDAATLDALAAAGTTVSDARTAARTKATTAADELTILTREQALLKLKDEICELQKKYGIACTVQP